MQKSYVSDPIQHTQVPNREAKVKQYYKENHHVAIIDRQCYQAAQTIAAMKDMHRGTSQYPYYGFLRCPLCGERMIRFQHPRNNHAFGWTCGGKTSPKGFLRKMRTKCPPFFILEPYIDKALLEALHSLDQWTLLTLKKTAGGEKAQCAAKLMEYQTKFSSKEKPRIEYILLHDTVESITFPKWTEMNVSWRCGLSSKVEIDYEKPADHPYPTITCEEYVHQRRRLKPYVTLTYMVNGIPLIKGCPKRQIRGIQRAQDEIQELIVLEPLGYEPDVPRVFGERTCSKRFEAESSRGEKRP